MATTNRNEFGGGLSDQAVSINGRDILLPPAGALATCWSGPPEDLDRVQYDDLRAIDDAATVISQIRFTAAGTLPRFKGPPNDAVTRLWVSADGGTTGLWLGMTDLHPVAATGSYIDLGDKPTIPTTPGQVAADPAGAAAAAQAAAIAAASTDATSKANAAQAGAQAASTPVAHATNTANPHAVTKAQVGLALADNTSDAGKPVSTAQATADANVLATATGRSIVNALIYGG